ncbi:hypothetical protein ACH9EU_11650 [Kocuria sp. M1R5S2]|uniref:hypothetical protein n=1 Tax=Kocuria rhizosphaerae TaxID=3376285 RepID=UPI0037951D67
MSPLLTQAAALPFWERLAVAAVGPLVLVLLGGLVVWGITHRVETAREDRLRSQDEARERAEKQRDEARADAEKNRELRARDDALRHELVSLMTESASSLYLMLQHFWRARTSLEQDPGDPALRKALSDLRAALDAQYLKSRACGEAIENRLWGYFVSERPTEEWHKVQDLLTVRYFQLIDRATDVLYAKNSGREHTGLTVEELRNRRTLLAAYHAALKDSVRAVFTETLRSRSSDR